MSIVRILTVAAALSVGASAAQAHGPAPDKNSPSGRLGKAKDVSRTIAVDVREYAFSQDDLTFKAGETVKFVIKNNGRLKHEFTVGTAQEQEAHSAAMKDMSDMKHSAEEHGDMPSNSVHVAPGETRELVWTFTQGGKLKFACNYPGHTDLGMEGKITVQ